VVDPDLDTALAVVRTATRLTADIDRSLGSWHGVALDDLALLLELQQAPERRLSRAELSERLGITAAAVTRRLAPLERIGVVERERHPSDARLSVAVLTPAGDTLATDAAVTAGDAAARHLADRWTDQERRSLRELLGLLA
jgi:DNA-binding MarR family transcriptional regulator